MLIVTLSNNNCVSAFTLPNNRINPASPSQVDLEASQFDHVSSLSSAGLSRYNAGVMTRRDSRRVSRSLSHSLAMKASTLPSYPVRVTVMGGGNFGLALATVLGRKAIPTTILVRSQEVADSLNANHRHPRYMSDLDLPTCIFATADPATALSDATYIIHAVPVQFSREFLMDVKDYVPTSVPVLSASKGIETSSLGFMADILKDCLGEDRSYAFLSGPSFAREICEGVATAVVVASDDMLLADDLADLMSSDNFRVFTSKDVMGIEIGGAVKNVIALAAGMCEGLGLGTNAMSGLVTRGCGEMRRLGLTLGARPSTIAGLSGVGDTFGTCFGPLSRNRRFGYRLGKGETRQEILDSTTEVAEGVDTSIALVNFIKKNCKGYRLDLKYPIIFGVANILEGDQTPLEGLKGLMNMPMRMENFDERL
eukprot:scaffold352502_cov61-Attheya_sp.AAC.1